MQYNFFTRKKVLNLYIDLQWQIVKSSIYSNSVYIVTISQSHYISIKEIENNAIVYQLTILCYYKY